MTGTLTRKQLAEQAEVSVLGAALADRDHCRLVLSRLAADDFAPTSGAAEAPNRRLFRLIADCARDDRYGPVAVLDMAERGKVDVGPQSVFELAGVHLTDDQLLDRIRQVAEAGFRRRMFDAGRRIQETAADFDVPQGRLVGTSLAALVDATLGHEQQVGIIRAADVAGQVRGLFDGETPTEGVTTGWGTLDQFYRPKKGRWTVVTGIPSHGKSSFMDALAVNLAEEHGWRIGFCSPEKLPVEEHIADLIALHVRSPFFADGFAGRMSHQQLEQAQAWVDDRFAWIVPEEHSRTVDGVLALTRLVHRQTPLDGLVIDPWNELEHSRDPSLTETEYISRSLTTVRAFARALDIHVWMIAHPTKLSKSVGGSYPVPTPYDISGSANWRNKADNAIAVWRDIGDRRKPVQIHVQKIRRQPWEGTEGRVDLRYAENTGRYIDDRA